MKRKDEQRSQPEKAGDGTDVICQDKELYHRLINGAGNKKSSQE